MEENYSPTIYTPEFIPFYPKIQAKYTLTDKETLLYGFIRFYISSRPDQQFFFSNQQLTEIIGTKSLDNISHMLSKLEKLGIIKCEYKIKSGGGKIRLVQWLSSELRQDSGQNLGETQVYINKNKENKNKEIYIMSNNGKTEKVGKEELSKLVERIFIAYREKIQKKGRLTEGAKKKVVARLKEFTVEELLDAIDKFSRDNWWMENNGERGMKWFFHTEDRIEQFINLKPRNGGKYGNNNADGDYYSKAAEEIDKLHGLR
jgi:hypothetical protein